MDDRFLRQLKKGILEMLVLDLICKKSTYGYDLMARLKEESQDFFSLKEGTLYPILYRLEDEGLIQSAWSQPEGKNGPKKIYSATETGYLEAQKRFALWQSFSATVTKLVQED